MLIQYLIICPMVFLAGFVDAVAGGGGLISLPAYMLAGLPMHNCLATNKMSSSMGTTIATAKYAMKGFIPWKQAGFCVVTAYLGSTLGANLALILSDYFLKVFMLFAIPVIAFFVLRGKVLTDDKEPFSFWKTTLIASIVAFIVGIYDGMYGPGTGTFLILLLTSLGHMNLTTANGTTKAINLTTNIAAVCVFFLNAKIIFPLGIIAGLFNIAGNYIGATLFEKKGLNIVKPIMLIVLVLFFIKVISDLM